MHTNVYMHDRNSITTLSPVQNTSRTPAMTSRHFVAQAGLYIHVYINIHEYINIRIHEYIDRESSVI